MDLQTDCHRSKLIKLRQQVPVPFTRLVLRMTISISWLVFFRFECLSGCRECLPLEITKNHLFLPHCLSVNTWAAQIKFPGAPETLRTQVMRKIVSWCDKTPGKIWDKLKRHQGFWRKKYKASKPKHCDYLHLTVKICNIVISKAAKLHLFMYFRQEDNFFLTQKSGRGKIIYQTLWPLKKLTLSHSRGALNTQTLFENL